MHQQIPLGPAPAVPTRTEMLALLQRAIVELEAVDVSEDLEASDDEE